MPAAAATTVRIQVVGAERNGHIVGAQLAMLEAADGRSYQVGGKPGEEQVHARLGTQTTAETEVSAGGPEGTAVYAVPFRSRDVPGQRAQPEDRVTWSR